MLSSHHSKTEMSKNKTKLLKKEPRKMENQKMIKKEEMNEGTTKKILHTMIKMILGLIIRKHSLGLLILSFGTPNPGLYYVPKKSILIKYGYSN